MQHRQREEERGLLLWFTRLGNKTHTKKYLSMGSYALSQDGSYMSSHSGSSFENNGEAWCGRGSDRLSCSMTLHTPWWDRPQSDFANTSAVGLIDPDLDCLQKNNWLYLYLCLHHHCHTHIQNWICGRADPLAGWVCCELVNELRWGDQLITSIWDYSISTTCEAPFGSQAPHDTHKVI